ncbi:phage major tail tube protein [Sphingosinicella sp. CPCC 101087]|uniref:phage major tail tube protein n=1 Tax=Sphingosinicella sp. CPCC 101087 TaxID=2497754 RepID=UPI00101DEF10
MALARKLKNMNLFNDGQSYLGQATTVTLPKLGRVFEDYRAAGMDGPVKIDMGQQPLEMEWTCGGFMSTIFRQYGVVSVDGVMLRWVGAYQNDQTGQVDAVEVVTRGRHEEIDSGEAKPGEDTELKVKSALAYYKLTAAGTELIEIDILNMIMRVGGVDRLAEQRAALGVGGGALGGLISPPALNLPGLGGLRIPGL